MSLFDIGLPKWPGIVIQGEDITPEQAQQVLIRTDSWHLSGNDQSWARLICLKTGIRWYNGQFSPDFDSIDEFRKNHRVLSLNYLQNRQIYSSYIAGPVGWCSWDGKINYSGHNIGKWPSVEDVYEDWLEIRRAFPFLNLRCQLFDREACEEGAVPLVEFVVTEDQVSIKKPEEVLNIAERDFAAEMDQLGFLYRERGCTASELQAALDTTRRALAKE